MGGMSVTWSYVLDAPSYIVTKTIFFFFIIIVINIAITHLHCNQTYHGHFDFGLPPVWTMVWSTNMQKWNKCIAWRDKVGDVNNGMVWFRWHGIMRCNNGWKVFLWSPNCFLAPHSRAAGSITGQKAIEGKPDNNTQSSASRLCDICHAAPKEL